LLEPDNSDTFVSSPPEDPEGLEILETKQDREFLEYERAKKNAELRGLESVIDDMWKGEIDIPDHSFSISGDDHDLSHDPHSHGDDGGRGGMGQIAGQKDAFSRGSSLKCAADYGIMDWSKQLVAYHARNSSFRC
jgi:hypothetical protein